MSMIFLFFLINQPSISRSNKKQSVLVKGTNNFSYETITHVYFKWMILLTLHYSLKCRFTSLRMKLWAVRHFFHQN